MAKFSSPVSNPFHESHDWHSANKIHTSDTEKLSTQEFVMARKSLHTPKPAAVPHGKLNPSFTSSAVNKGGGKAAGLGTS